MQSDHQRQVERHLGSTARRREHGELQSHRQGQVGRHLTCTARRRERREKHSDRQAQVPGHPHRPIFRPTEPGRIGYVICISSRTSGAPGAGGSASMCHPHTQGEARRDHPIAAPRRPAPTRCRAPHVPQAIPLAGRGFAHTAGAKVGTARRRERWLDEVGFEVVGVNIKK